MTEPINYKLASAILLCLVFAFGILMVTGLKCNDRIDHIKTKKEILNNIDSLEKVDTKQILQIDSTEQSRKPIEQRIAKRDGTLVEITKRKDEKYKEILADSSNVDFVEFNRILTELVSEYKIN